VILILKEQRKIMFQTCHTGLMMALLISNPNTLRCDHGAGGELAGPACLVDTARMDPDRFGVAPPLGFAATRFVLSCTE